MADQRSEIDLVEEFCRITGCDQTRGHYYLSTRNWDLDEAVSYFFDNPHSSPDSPDLSAAQPPNIPSQASSQNEPPPSSRGRTTGGPRIATLSSILQGRQQDDEEEGQAFYAGGSERSGQQVLGPSKKNYPEIVEQMFKAAQSHGAQLVDPAQPRRKEKFQGQGHRLGSSPSEENAAVGSSSAPEEDTSAPVEITLNLWQNGFTLDSGPLRPYSNPGSMAFLDAVTRGEIPPEIRTMYPRREVNLNMKDQRHQSYAPPTTSAAPRAFTGAGHRLGSPMPTLPGESLSAPASPEALQDYQKQAESGLGLNPEEPTTSLQVRLADGSRLVIRCNHKHTLADIRQYIVTARPEYATQLFSLLTQYPTIELNDDSSSLKELNLLSTSLVLKLK